MRGHGLVLCVVLVALLGATGAVSGTQVSEETCSGVNETTVLGVTPTGDAFEETVRLYPGSTLSVVVCEDEARVSRADGTWTVGESSAYTVDARTNYTVDITAVEGNLSLAEIVSGEVDPGRGLEIEAPDETVYGADRLLDTRLRLYSIDARTELENRAATFEARVAAIANATEELESFNISAGDDPAAAADYANILRELADARGDALNQTAAMELVLYEQARNHPQPENTTMAMETLQNERSSVVTQTDEAAAQSLATLESVNSEIQSTVRRNVGIGTAGGLVLGVAAGVIIPWRKGKEVEDFYQVSKGNKFTVSVLTIPWVVGGILLGGGLVALFVFDILGVMV